MTEDDVRRIVREEIAAAKAADVESQAQSDKEIYDYVFGAIRNSSEMTASVISRGRPS